MTKTEDFIGYKGTIVKEFACSQEELVKKFNAYFRRVNWETISEDEDGVYLRTRPLKVLADKDENGNIVEIFVTFTNDVSTYKMITYTLEK